MFHWLMLAQGGAAFMLGMIFKPSALLMAVLLLLWLAHQLTTWLELRYVSQRRNIIPVEQMVHSFLEILPLAMIVVMAIDVSVQGASAYGAFWKLDARDAAAFPVLKVTAYALAGITLVIAPFAEEAWRCFHYRNEHREAPPPASPERL